MDELERTFWSMMSRFEGLAQELYRQHAPALAVASKADLVRRLREVPAPAEGSPGPLTEAVDALLARAQARDPAEVLLIWGLFLEPLGQIVYRLVGARPVLSEAGRHLGAAALSASAEATQRVEAVIRAELGEGDALLDQFLRVTRPVLGALDSFGEAVDEAFGDRFGLRFAELLGQLSGQLLPTCVALGMQRRRVVMHLASALMGGDD